MITSYLDVPDLQPNFKPGTLPISTMRVPSEAIPGAETQLWRFIDFPKFVSLLDQRALFFTRADKLEDPFEGTWSNATLQLLKGTVEREIIEQDEHVVLRSTATKQSLKLVRPFSVAYGPAEREIFERIFVQGQPDDVQISNSRKNVIFHHVPTGQRFIVFDMAGTIENQGQAVAYPLLDRDKTIAAAQQMVSASQTRSRFTMINCWHESDYESEAMWRLYSGDKYGIAIRTNAKSLVNCFVKRYPNALAKVQYIPYNDAVMPIEGDTPFLYKRINFADEREIRVIMTEYVQYQEINGARNTVQIDFSRDVCDVGLYYDIAPEQLIHEIVLSPYATPWLLDLTRSVTKKYGLNVPVVPSTLGEQPSL